MRSKMKLLKMSVRDEMTGALNRRGMAIELDRLLKSANADGILDVSLEFNGDFKDTSTVCFEINVE